MARSGRNNKINRADAAPMDPLGFDESPEYSSGAPKARQKRPSPGKKLSRRDKQQVIRVENIKKALEEYGDDIDTDAVVSLYLPQRRARRFGAALLRLNRLHLLLLLLLFGLAILFIMAFTQEKMGNFTINLNRLEMYRKGISISADADFTNATARLVASAVDDATNISITDLPPGLDDVDGDHNGRNYMAYTYYVRNAGKEDVSYYASVTLDSCAKGAENAVRVSVWRNGENTVYAMPSADGSPEDGCVNFLTRNIVCTYLIGNVDKYTIVIWMEGDDPECIDNIVGGSVQFSMNIDADDHNDSPLIVKFIQDIIDTITGNKPISSSSDADVPSYYWDKEITWATRRNQ